MSHTNLPNIESLELEDLQRFIERCRAELDRRLRKPISEKEVMLSLGSQLAVYRRRKEKELADLRDRFMK